MASQKYQSQPITSKQINFIYQIASNLGTSKEIHNSLKEEGALKRLWSLDKITADLLIRAIFRNDSLEFKNLWG
jgi:hypothetical protein